MTKINITYWPLGDVVVILKVKTPVRCIPQDTFVDKSTLFQIMAWCHPATSHYLSQWGPRSMSLYDITRYLES